MTKAALLRSRMSMKVCAVVRAKGIATKGGRSSEQMTSRWTANLNPKGGGDKSMFVKRGVSEGVYDTVLQRLSDKVKARLAWILMSSGGNSHSREARLLT